LFAIVVSIPPTAKLRCERLDVSALLIICSSPSTGTSRKWQDVLHIAEVPTAGVALVEQKLVDAKVAARAEKRL